MPPIYDGLVILCWLLFLGYWSVASVGAKPDRGQKDAWKSSLFALRVTFLFFVVVLTFAARAQVLQLFALHPVVPDDSITDAAGTVICALGMAIAIWARVYLGRNWSDSPSLKEGHHLVVTGPYRYVRNPIYAGVLTAALGSALVGGAVWIFVLVVTAVMFAYRMQKEQRLLSAEFPSEYAAYKKRTTSLIPFLL